MKHDNWRNYTIDDLDLVFMHPDNKDYEKTYKVKLYNYMFFNCMTVGEMVDQGPAVWLRERSVGRKTVNTFIEIINNFIGEKIFKSAQLNPEQKNNSEPTPAMLRRLEESKKKRAAVYKMRFENDLSWKEIGKFFGVSASVVKNWDKRHRKENNLPAKHVDNLNLQLVEARKELNQLHEDMYLLVHYLKNQGHHEIAQIIHTRLINGRGS